MKSIFYWMMLIPFLVFSQNEQDSHEEYLIVGTTVFSAKSDKMKEFSEGMKNHNQQFHDQGAMGVRIFNILNGQNANSFMAVMGPMPWSALDEPELNQQAHDTDWINNVVPYIAEENETNFWKFHHRLSHFPPGFEMSKLKVSVWDIERGEYQAMLKGLDKVSKVLKEKLPEMPFGIYTNEFSSTKSGQDLSVVYFFDEFSWLAKDIQLKEKYNEVYGEGAFDTFLQEWMDTTKGASQELWVYNQDLSGIGPQVTTATKD
ncbi:hypothetical protein DET49_11359 [Salegentibacter sp. 24]|uniref:hypothetical protein n=1 Tax=Salegentibacter sp. 24 TaxID=2183986 RepID=UPI00105DC921|nr:hypothetical protein [Salegentibacter sp. 24]TDN87198.1 hypothetical protein DET49_11359 [Salegentibacter sp. 24]